MFQSATPPPPTPSGKRYIHLCYQNTKKFCFILQRHFCPPLPPPPPSWEPAGWCYIGERAAPLNTVFTASLLQCLAFVSGWGDQTMLSLMCIRDITHVWQWRIRGMIWPVSHDLSQEVWAGPCNVICATRYELWYVRHAVRSTSCGVIFSTSVMWYDLWYVVCML